MFNLKTSIATAFLLAPTDARRHLDDRIDHHSAVTSPSQLQVAATQEDYTPLVEASDCPKMCLFEDDDNSFCWKFQSPML